MCCILFAQNVQVKGKVVSENVTQGLLSGDNAGIGWDDTMCDPWYSYYQYISKLNLFLEKIDNVPGDETSRNEQKGQALFLRAWNYHCLLYTSPNIRIYHSCIIKFFIE